MGAAARCLGNGWEMTRQLKLDRESERVQCHCARRACRRLFAVVPRPCPSTSALGDRRNSDLAAMNRRLGDARTALRGDTARLTTVTQAVPPMRRDCGHHRCLGIWRRQHALALLGRGTPINEGRKITGSSKWTHDGSLESLFGRPMTTALLGRGATGSVAKPVRWTLSSQAAGVCSPVNEGALCCAK